ncbi:MAG: phosphoheptose isomerase [Candidatus Omnitrophica bacterium CG11_big_fil_rev_8_21_14_0_20_64_10]|nr:MAG: phosphoheptose isomerase [Candidatus Omnitrophica bacterium CG11_big_fil_rev_8_21_14_0_20_64_10]
MSGSKFSKEIVERIEESIQTKQRVRDRIVPEISRAAEVMIAALDAGKKILFFGNGGSAADSQHLAAELIGKMFNPKRRALPAVALTTDSSNLTALGNDFGFETVFSRQIEGLGQAGDVAIGITTSGQSPNVLEAMKTARTRGLKTIGLIGKDGGPLKGLVDIAIIVPSDSTQRIQESHITIGQILCELVELHFSD